jgi:Glycosyltransferase sugar-binding region containing DXD motif
MIPNIFHFVFGMKPDFGGKPFNMVHYLAVKSAAELNQPDKMILHYQYEPTGEWFEKARPYLVLNKIVAPESIHGNKLHHVAHQADIVRLQMLQEHGGIYLDLDTISKKSLADLRNNSFVIAKEFKPPVYYTNWDRIKNALRQFKLAPLTEKQKVYGLCNAVMLSEPGSPFIELWLDSYKTFRSKGKDEFWVEHSVKVPFELAEQHPGLLTILEPYAFHYPAYDPKGLKWLFEKSVDYPDAYLHHLWETNAWNYISALTPSKILDEDSTYNMIARRFISR